MSITTIIKHTAEIILSTIYGVDNIWLRAILPTLVSLLKSEIIINFNILPHGLHRGVANIIKFLKVVLEYSSFVVLEDQVILI